MAQFQLTGPRGKQWSLTTPDGITNETLERLIDGSIRKNSGIMSRDYEWIFDFDDQAGGIYVGGGRKVGEIRGVTTESEQANLRGGG